MSPSTVLVSVLILLFAASSVAVYEAPSSRPETEETSNDAPKFKPATNVKFNKKKQTMKAILSMDGGGMRGIITVEVLSVVESSIKKVLRSHADEYKVSDKGELEIDLADYFTAMAGVNSGCWIASYLASKCGNGACSAVFDDRRIINRYGNIRPGSVDGLKVFFKEYGPKIYRRLNFDFFSVDHIFRFPWMKIPGWTFTTHPAKGLEDTLNLFLGEADMEDLSTILFVPAYDLIRKAAVLFVSGNFREIRNVTEPSYTYILETTDKPRDPDPFPQWWAPTVKVYTNKKYRLRDLAHAGGAAAMMHEAKAFSAINDESFEFYCIDGSLMANNPTYQTLIFMASNYGGNMHDVSILSIGTGITGGAMSDRAKSGAWQWLYRTNDFFTVVMDGGSELIQAQLDMFFYFVLREGAHIRRNQYLRVQTSADETRAEGRVLSEVDSIGLIEELTEIGKQTANTFRDSIDDFVLAHIFGKKLDEHRFEGFLQKDPALYSRAEAKEASPPTRWVVVPARVVTTPATPTTPSPEPITIS